MPISVACAECDKKLKVADTAAGKKIRCPSCKAVVAVPEAEDFVEPDEEDTAVTVEPPKRKPSSKRRYEDDDFEDEEEEERRPRKKKKKKKRRFDDRPNSDVPHRGITIIIMGISSILFGCFPIAGWYLGYTAMNMANVDLEEMDRNRIDRSGRTLTQIGKYCGIAGATLSLGWFLLGCVLAIAGRIG